MSAEEIEKLASNEVQEYIFSHANDDENKLLFKHKTILGFSAALIAQQIAARRKAQAKLPTFHSIKGIIYPPSINLEQSSSEATAKFKAKIIRDEFDDRKIKVADLTGGFGVDSFFLSEVSESLNYVEPNVELLNIVKHNHRLLGGKNISHHLGSAEEFLRQKNDFDFLFLDPSRRSSQNKKIFLLSDCEPDVPYLLTRLLEHSKLILIKTSPLLDIQSGLKDLRFVKKVFVISVSNECKELLFMVQQDFDGIPSIETFNLENNGNIKHYFRFSIEEENDSFSDFSDPEKYLYEPNSSILKSGAFKIIGQQYNLKKLAVNTHLYTSDELKMDFPGRAFEILNQKFDLASLKEKKANIISRNHPMTPAELKKKFKLGDGGENYLIAFSGCEKKYAVLAKRLA